MSESQDVITLPEFEGPVEFFGGYLAPTFARHLGSDVHWCAQWYRHFEAWKVVGALHQVYEELRRGEKPGWEAVFLRDWGYPLMDRLLSPNGTFAQCYTGVVAPEHHDPHALPWASNPVRT